MFQNQNQHHRKNVLHGAPYNGIPPVKWQRGLKSTHNGKKWESMVDNNVWEPGAFGVGAEIWKEIMQ